VKLEFKITSIFANNDMIPAKYTTDGEDISPPLKLENIASEAKSIALICDDPDAPMGTFVHWVIWNIPVDNKEIPEGIPTSEKIAELGNACQGKNDFGVLGYKGPAPPGGTHTYRFQLYALDTKLDLKPGVSKEKLLDKMEEHILQKSLLRGKYSR
jgi:hypothetical protein